MTRQRVAAAVVAGVAGVIMLAACGSGAKTVSATTLLARAHTTINAASAVHFTVTSNKLPNAGTVLKSGNGDLARPDELRGAFQIAIDSLPTSISIIETGNKFYVKLPFQTSYQVSDPAKFGFGDPGSIIDPNTGISRLLVQISNPKVTGKTRVNGELLENISGTVPGTDVTQFLPDVARSQPVQLVLGINTTSNQVRQVQATGPFAVATTQSTYLVTLTNYNEAVTITAPAT